MNRSPAFQFYPDRWISHVLHLSAEAYMVYHRMLCWMWLHSENQCSIPSEPGAIAVALAMPCTCIASALHEIQNPHMPLLKIAGKMFVSEGLKKEATKQTEHRAKKVNAANAMHAKRLQAMHVQSTCSAPATNVQCFPSPSPSPSPSPTRLESTITPLPPAGGETNSQESVVDSKPPKKPRAKKTKPSTAYTPAFETFYAAYPRHRLSHKPTVFEVWLSVAGEGESVAPAIMDALDIDLRRPDWKRDGGKWVKNADKWLSNQTWGMPKEQIESGQFGCDGVDITNPDDVMKTFFRPMTGAAK